MINVKICKDVKSAETKLIFNLTARQLVCVLMAIAVSIGAFLLLKPFLDIEAIFVVITFLCVPFFGVGFVKVYGLPLEKFLYIIYFDNVKSDAKLKYKTQNFYSVKDHQIITAADLDATEEVVEESDDKKKKPKKKAKKTKYKKSKLAIK